jgi:hypothetical protein
MAAHVPPSAAVMSSARTCHSSCSLDENEQDDNGGDPTDLQEIRRMVLAGRQEELSTQQKAKLLRKIITLKKQLNAVLDQAHGYADFMLIFTPIPMINTMSLARQNRGTMKSFQALADLTVVRVDGQEDSRVLAFLQGLLNSATTSLNAKNTGASNEQLTATGEEVSANDEELAATGEALGANDESPNDEEVLECSNLLRVGVRLRGAVAEETLQDWFEKHRQHPFPTSNDKIQLAQYTGIGVNQVNDCA